MADHVGASVVAPGSPCRKSNLDALAAESVYFGRCISTGDLIAPFA